MGTLQELEERVNALETELNEFKTRCHKRHTWVRYIDPDTGRPSYCNIAFCEALSIPYDPTEYRSATEARTGRLKG